MGASYHGNQGMEMKKGFLLSLFVISALALIVLTFRTNLQFREQVRADIFKDRIEQTNLFVEDIEKDIERTLYVTTFRAFLGIDEYITKNEEYIKPFDITGKPMKGWVMVSPDYVETEDELLEMLKLGVSFTDTIPKK